MARVFLLWLAMASLAFAQGEEVEVLFNTDPPGAEVWINADFIGLSGKRLPVSLQHGAQLDVSFRMQGFKPRDESIMTDRLLSNANLAYPLNGGALILEPTGMSGYLRKYPRLPVLLGLGLALMAVAALMGRKHQRQLQRARQVEEWIAQAPEDASRVARTLGGYLLVDVLGGGGMAQVYRGIPADTLDPSKAVAVKLLHRSLAGDEDHRRRFEREIGVCQKLDHPNIVRTLDWGLEDDGRTYLLMELVQGGSLRERILPEGLSGAEAQRLLEPIFSAVQYAHEQGIVHRDLKPENILVSAKGVPKVSDFGLARSGDSETLTETGTALGTPAYMAPEQVGGQRAGPAADQYALGILAYEILTGRKPFENADPIQLIFMHVSENARPPSSLRRTIPPELDEVVLRMLSKEPDSRYADLNEAWSALQPGLAIL